MLPNVFSTLKKDDSIFLIYQSTKLQWEASGYPWYRCQQVERLILSLGHDSLKFMSLCCPGCPHPVIPLQCRIAALNIGGNRSTVAACWSAGQQVKQVTLREGYDS